MNTQERLRELFLLGKVTGETTVPEHIETVMSHVYLFPDRVYKIYKGDNEWFNKNFNDLSDTKKRFEFSKNDFHVNQLLCPEVYVRIVGAEVEGEQVTFTDYSLESSEVVLVMNKIDAKNFLFNQIAAGSLSAEEYKICGHSFAQRLRALRNEKFTVPPEPWSERFKNRMFDLRLWLKGHPSIDLELAETYCRNLEVLADSRKGDPDWSTTQKITKDIDTHSFNGVYKDGVFYLLDSYLPKDSWMFSHELLAPYRFATDIWAFSGEKKYFDSFMNGYEPMSQQKWNRTDELIFVLYASLIMWVYLYNLSESDASKLVLAKKYEDFLAKYHAAYVMPEVTRLVVHP